MELIHPAIEMYAYEHSTPESEILQELVRLTDEELEYSNMLSGRVVGRFLAMMVKTSGAKHILEIGTFTGYSALSMAEALPEDGRLISCEYNERYEKIARHFFKKSEHGHKIDLCMGPALQTIEGLKTQFDLVFLDADKSNYPNYYRAVLPKIKEGGLLIIDNVLWSGSVLAPDTDKAKAIDELNTMICEDERVEQVLLTVRDGFTLLRKV